MRRFLPEEVVHGASVDRNLLRVSFLRNFGHRDTSMQFSTVTSHSPRGCRVAPFALSFLGALAPAVAMTSAGTALGQGSLPSVELVAPVTAAPEGSTLTLQVVLSQPATAETVVSLFLNGDFPGGATPWADYVVLADNPVIFQPGESVRDFPIELLDDTVYEGDETIEVSIPLVLGATLGTTTQVTLTILDNDPQPPPKQRVSGHSQGPGHVVVGVTPKAVPPALAFDIVDEGGSDVLGFSLVNPTSQPITISTLRITNLGDTASGLSVGLGGSSYQGGATDVAYSPGDVIASGASAPVQVTFAPDQHGIYDVELSFEGAFGAVVVPVDAVSGFAGHPYLHPVVNVAPLAIDYDGDGQAMVLLDGSGSHTHEPGKSLTSWTWVANGQIVSQLEVDSVPFGLGDMSVQLTIADDNVPPQTLSTTTGFQVVPVDTVPGVLALYYDPRAGLSPSDLLDIPPSNADFAEVVSTFDIGPQDGGIGGSGMGPNLMVRLIGDVHVEAPGTWEFSAIGGSEHRLFFDGSPVAGPIQLSVGSHTIEARFAVIGLGDLPLNIMVDVDGQGAGLLQPMALTHDQQVTPPVINAMPTEGTVLGGNQIVLEGFGFFPQSEVSVHWGTQVLTQNDFVSWGADRIEFLSPQGTGTISVKVETPNGSSNVLPFTYLVDGPVPINFTLQSQATIVQPTAAAWGPDQRLYVVARTGQLHAITYGDNYHIQSVDTYPGVSGLPNHEAMGLAFNPYEGPSRVKVYVAHTEMYAQGGLSFTGPSPYPGQVSLLQGPSFDTPFPILTQLPTSNHDHGINGMLFDSAGDLLIAVGGNTNAGVIHPQIGDLPESPLTAAIIRARLSDPNFDGALSYVETDSGLPNNDQVFGHIVDLAPGTLVDVWTTGLRNTFDFDLHTNGYLYGTDNGPNNGFGFKSTGPTTDSGTHAISADEMLLLERDHYYGHPNRARGRYNPIENVYFAPSDPSGGGYTEQLATLASSMNGIAEYRSETFGGQMRGDLLTQKYQATFWRVKLTEDGRSAMSASVLSPVTGGLGLETGPGGALIISSYNANRVRVYLPNDLAVQGMTPYDITPWRAVPNTFFTIGGMNFGTLANTSVTFGGVPATLTSVSPTRIRGIVPPSPSASVNLVDISVTSAGTTGFLPKAFRWLYGTPDPGTWETHQPNMPMPAGEVACGVINGVLYLVGEGNNNTYAYNIGQAQWSTNLAQRQFPGNHHGAEVVGGKWYLIGGLGSGNGLVQIYDPVANQWTLGANMPWNGGSVSTALIDGKIYASGGIVGSITVDNCAVYDPVTNAWTSLAPMPVGKGRNHSAAGTDGELFWIFGGRGQGSGAANVVANGFGDVQVYDPSTNTWSASFDVGSPLVPLPIGRGGTGKAVYFDGEFFVFGGETLTEPNAEPGNVYNRVDVYDPSSHSWRTETEMPTARHGIFPILHQGKVYVAGGGVVAGFSASSEFEVFVP